MRCGWKALGRQFTEASLIDKGLFSIALAVTSLIIVIVLSVVAVVAGQVWIFLHGC